MKIVAIDFDETISDNPDGWLRVMRTLEIVGYHVIVVTYRQPNCYPQDLQFLVDKGYKVIYTAQQAKRDFCSALGYDVAIWIDDTPESITCDYSPTLGFH